jgi:hypothetical protein
MSIELGSERIDEAENERRKAMEKKAIKGKGILGKEEATHAGRRVACSRPCTPASIRCLTMCSNSGSKFTEKCCMDAQGEHQYCTETKFG